MGIQKYTTHQPEVSRLGPCNNFRLTFIADQDCPLEEADHFENGLPLKFIYQTQNLFH